MIFSQTSVIPARPVPTAVAATAASGTLTSDDAGRLTFAAAAGDGHALVVPLRTFPISEPDGQIALLTEQGRELAFIESLTVLSGGAADLVRRELACREFVPIIHRIVSSTDDVDLPRWQLETDRGFTEALVHVDDGLRRWGERGLLVVDIHGLRFVIPHTLELDMASRRILDRYL